MNSNDYIINHDDIILITGANGFIGFRVIEQLLHLGFINLRCFIRPSADTSSLNSLMAEYPNALIELIKGNLLSIKDCVSACQNTRLIIHLAAGVSKSFADCVMNSALTTKNLLNSVKSDKNFVRFLNVSSISVYSGVGIKSGMILDETSSVEKQSYMREEAYTFGKIKQDEIISYFHSQYKIPFVTVRPGVVYGPGKANIMGRVGIDSFGIFFHIGGSSKLPLTYVDNCANAIVLCSIKNGIDGEIFNIIDDDIPSCRKFLKMYKKNVHSFFSIRVPYRVFYLMSLFWEKYAHWSRGQLPPVFNRMRCAAHWKKRKFSNNKLKNIVGWSPKIPTKEGLDIYFNYLKARNK